MTTLGAFLGANRSLTTLLSAIFALHPEITVLNHGFARILADPSRNFLSNPAPETLDRFVAEARDMALGGRRGDFGGHILHSHAFDDEALRQAYLDRFGWVAKPLARSLVWKDATNLTRYIMNRGIDIDALCRRLPSLRFMMMVRNPVDITISSIRKGYSAALVGEARKDQFDDVFAHIVKLFDRFSLHAQRNPAQCRFIFQDELLDREHLIDQCDFLEVSADTDWLDEVARLISLRPSYPIDPAMRTRLRGIVTEIIGHEPTALRVCDQIN